MIKIVIKTKNIFVLKPKFDDANTDGINIKL